MGCEDALTGPVDRNDVGTVRKHLTAMSEMCGKNAIIDVYKLLSRELIEIAEAKYPERDYSELSQAIGKEK